MKTVTIIANSAGDWDYEGYYVDGKLIVDGNPDDPDMIVTLLEELGHKVVIHELTNEELNQVVGVDGGYPNELPEEIPLQRNTIITK